MKRYLGDAVYAGFERGMIRLTVEDGISVQSEIWLEPVVYDALVRFAESIRADSSEPIVCANCIVHFAGGGRVDNKILPCRNGLPTECQPPKAVP